MRGLVCDPAQREAVSDKGVAEVAVGDLRNRASLDAALAGVGSVFCIAPAFMSGEADVGVGFVEAAKQAGVRRFVSSLR